ncbi:hypothetical protein ACFLTZ_05455 [Chloroflexota bacterium]
MEAYLMPSVSLMIPVGFSMLAIALYSTPTKPMLAIVAVFGILPGMICLQKAFKTIRDKDLENIKLRASCKKAMLRWVFNRGRI